MAQYRLPRWPFPEITYTEACELPSENPSFVIKDGQGHYFAVSENDPHSGVYSYSGSKVTAFRDNSDFCPCHLILLDGAIYTADYGRGSISSFPVVDGIVQTKSGCISFDGSGPEPVRQTHSYIHQLQIIPEEICRNLGLEDKWVLASDLGDDTIHVLHKEDGKPLEDCPELIICPIP